MAKPQAYGQYCPVTRALETVGERWTLLMVRDLLGGPLGFNELSRGLPNMSRSLLSTRLRRLQDMLIVEQTPAGYQLTEVGMRLGPVVQSLSEWGAENVFDRPRPDELDHQLLMWWMKGRLDTSGYHGERTTLEFRFRDPNGIGWLVVRPGDVDVCMHDPGYDVDLTISVDAASWAELWLGKREWPDLLRRGDIDLHGHRPTAKVFPTSLMLSYSADTVRRAASDGSAG